MDTTSVRLRQLSCIFTGDSRPPRETPPETPSLRSFATVNVFNAYKYIQSQPDKSCCLALNGSETSRFNTCATWISHWENCGHLLHAMNWCYVQIPKRWSKNYEHTSFWSSSSLTVFWITDATSQPQKIYVRNLLQQSFPSNFLA